MMTKLSKDACALVTGASSGLGAEFALQLAPHVGKLILVARREEQLASVSNRLKAEFPELEVAFYAVDLSDVEARLSLVKKLVQAGDVVDFLINNAGLGDYGEFSNADWPKLEQMLKVNVEALTHLTHLFVPQMIRKGGGAVVNVSSLASVIPIPDFAVYAATKAYVTSFSEALHIELKEYQIAVVAVCPGPVHTEFGMIARRADGSGEMPSKERLYVTKEQVVRDALDAVARRSPRVYPGVKIAVIATFLSALPIMLVRLIMGFRPRR